MMISNVRRGNVQGIIANDSQNVASKVEMEFDAGTVSAFENSRDKPPTPSTSPRLALGQRGRDEVAGPAAETGTGVGRSADVPEPADCGCVAAGRG